MENKDIKILVVDDENDFRNLLTFWLKSKGYTIVEADNGKRAIAMVKEEKPDIVFMDLNMPQMNGAETIKEIRTFDTEVPVIVISSYIDDRKAKVAMESGISGVFYKGKDFEEGLSLLEAALRTHRKLKK